jgi:hypothetical protein
MTMLNWMHRGRNGQDEGRDLDEFPQFRDLPRGADPVRRQWRQKVMEAGQYVEELEAKVAAQAEEIGTQANHIRLLEEAQRLVRRQLGDTTTENHKLRDALARTQTKLQVSGQLVLQALDELAAWKLADQPQQAETNVPSADDFEDAPNDHEN